MSLVVLIGGARSGKTSLAVQLGTRYDDAGRGPVTYLATAPVIDDEMEHRIAHHRNERPASWCTVEEELDLGAALERIPDGLVVVDCLTLWTSNMMWHRFDDVEIAHRSADAAAIATARTAPVVAVTNEVGQGIVPDNEVARRYRDVHGRVNQEWVAAATTALHVVAGRAVRLDDPLALLDGLI